MTGLDPGKKCRLAVFGAAAQQQEGQRRHDGQRDEQRCQHGKDEGKGERRKK